MKVAWTGWMALLTLAWAAPAPAQEGAAGFPFGTPVIFLPVQAATPAPGGEWPGHARSQEDALRAMDAEIEFALAGRRGAESWALPSAVRQRLARNPLVDVHADRLAYEGLIRKPDARDQIYEPLHGQLRALAALFGARYLALPLVLSVTPAEDVAEGDAAPCGDRGQPVRAQLLMALVDIRRSAVMWHGDVRGPSVCPGDGGLLAGLAELIGHELVDS